MPICCRTGQVLVYSLLELNATCYRNDLNSLVLQEQVSSSQTHRGRKREQNCEYNLTTKVPYWNLSAFLLADSNELPKSVICTGTRAIIIYLLRVAWAHSLSGSIPFSILKMDLRWRRRQAMGENYSIPLLFHDGYFLLGFVPSLHYLPISHTNISDAVV